MTPEEIAETYSYEIVKLALQMAKEQGEGINGTGRTDIQKE